MNQTNEKILPFEQVRYSLESLYVRHLNKSKAIYWIMVLSLGIFLVVLPYLKISISTQSRGLISTPQQNNTINTVIYGQISEQYMLENKRVEKGDLLLVLNTRKIDDKLSFQKKQIKKNEAFIQDLENLIQMDSAGLPELQSSLYNFTLFQYQKQLGEHQLQLDQLVRQLDRSTQLVESGAIARVDYENHLFQRDLQQNTLESFIRQQKKAWEAEIQQYRTQNEELQASNQQLMQERTQYFIKAPISGTITQFSGLQVGNFISPGQNIAQIAADDSLMVDCMLDPSDIGLLYEGMPVKFQIDAFNYNHWGLANGKVDMISKDIMMKQGQAYFLVRCTLEEKQLYLKNGYEGQLKKGMTLSARFQITERSLYQLLYDKVDNWLNPKMNVSSPKS